MESKRTKNNTSNVLVTGGTGFIGSHLVEKLLEQGRYVKVLALKDPIEKIEKENEELIKAKGAKIVYGNICDVKSLEKAIKNIDIVFHLAAISRPMAVTDEEYYNVNVKGTENILEVSRKANVKKFIHVSTVSVLGVSPDGHPLCEEEFQYDDLKYGQTKREGERMALLYHYKYKVPLVVIRPCLVYGPRCMVRLVMFKFVKMGIFPLFSKGNAKMEFVYVDNVIQALLLAEKNESVIGKTFNITDGQSYKIITVLKTIADELQVQQPKFNLNPKLGYYLGIASEFLSKLIGIYPPFSRTASHWMSNDVNVYDCSYAKNVLGYNPKINLHEGIKKTVLWFKSRGDL